MLTNASRTGQAFLGQYLLNVVAFGHSKLILGLVGCPFMGGTKAKLMFGNISDFNFKT